MRQVITGCEYFTLDVFTTERFGGNPLAVVNEADELSDKVMQQIATEFNLSETVFVLRARQPENTARLRIFTPTRELPFAGHPTIGTAVLLAEMGADFSRDWTKNIRLEENIGLVEVSVTKTSKAPTYGELTAAKLPEYIGDEPDDACVAGALGISEKDIGFGLHKTAFYDAGNAPLFVPLASRKVLENIDPDQSCWEDLGVAGEFGIYAYCRGGNGSEEFHARLFGPEKGIVEDPATGSAAVAFAGALNEALVLEDGCHSWVIHQGEDMGRPSRIDLKAEVAGGAITAVKIGGNALRVSRGVISI
ncbi:MAG TPA: PhzF family phenazine biosynthesis protein [Rhizobiales bacterium]|nr:PhzF family phenazine biosynthesis protein [Hyphomicrobiales bacterium]